VIRAALVTITLAIGLAGCTADAPPRTLPDGRRLEEGETLGAIERLPGGTPVLSDVRTFINLNCRDGLVTLRTNAEVITGRMDCGQTPPQSIVDQFTGRPIAMNYEEERLRIESPEVGTLDLPVTDAETAPAPEEQRAAP
jgi:hypothetical protein